MLHVLDVDVCECLVKPGDGPFSLGYFPFEVAICWLFDVAEVGVVAFDQKFAELEVSLLDVCVYVWCYACADDVSCHMVVEVEVLYKIIWYYSIYYSIIIYYIVFVLSNT